MNRQTKGPWKWIDGPREIWGPKRETVAEVENPLDGHLIAAAPDMLTALEWLLAEFRDYMEDPEGADMLPEAQLQAEWAIAKAKGQQ